MTMIQCVIRPDRAWVVADSLCYHVDGGGIVRDVDGRMLEDAKLIPMRGFVLTSLGALELRYRAVAKAQDLAGLDDCIAVLPQALRDAYASLGLGRQPERLHTVLCIGWSEQRACMACAVFAAGRDFLPEVWGSAGGCVFWECPPLPRAPLANVPEDLPALLEHAHATVKHWREGDAATPIGGALQLAEITRAGITRHIVGDLGFPGAENKERDMSKVAMAAAVLALSACGGGGEAIEAGQLVPGAATEVFTDLVATTTINSTPNTPILRTLPKTSPGTYEITLSGRFDVTSFTSTAQMRVYFQVGISGTYIGDLNPTYTVMANGQSIQVSQTITVDIGPLADGSVSVMLQIPSGTASGTMSNLCMRSTLIKR